MTEDVQQLHRLCVQALSAYIEQATKTCGMLKSIESFPVNAEVRQKILNQRFEENAAHELYQIARRNFFDAVKWKDSEDRK